MTTEETKLQEEEAVSSVSPEDFDFDLAPQLSRKFYAAGVKFRSDWKENLGRLKEEEELLLIPEPTNKFDENAVKICSFEGVFLGYVPAKIGANKWVLDALYEGRGVKATVKKVDLFAEPWQALLVEVWIKPIVGKET